MRKVNGLTQKAHPFQILAYIVFLAIFTTYFLIAFPLSTNTTRVIGAILEVAGALAVAISGYIVTATDPSDTLLLETLEERAKGNFIVEKKSEFICSYDKAYVHETSKHCKRCGRCTEGFDHHCKWINNDIGKKNYKPFIVMILSVLFFLATFLVFGAIVTADYISDPNFAHHRIYLYNNSPEDILSGLIVLWVMMTLSFLLLILDTNLVLFHIFLIRKGLTTFQYLTLVEERRENKREMEIAKQAMGSQKKTWLDFVLCLGKKQKKVNKESVEMQEKEEHKFKKAASKDQVPNQEQLSDAKLEGKDKHDHQEIEEEANIKIASNYETLTKRNVNRNDILHTEENMLLSTKNETRINIKDSAFETQDQEKFSLHTESPEKVIHLEATDSPVAIHKLQYETHQIKKFSSETREISQCSAIEKKRKLILNLDMINQGDPKNLISSNQSSHYNQMNVCSFDKTKSQSDVQGLGEDEHEETNETKLTEKVQLINDHGKSRFLLQGFESLNKVKKSPVQNLPGREGLIKSISIKDRNNDEYRELDIEAL